MAKTAVIIGGSNAGLMRGIMLKYHGYNVTVLEQDISTSRQGYDAGIKEGPDLHVFLKKHDRVKRPHSISYLSPKTINQDGKVQSQAGKEMVTTNRALLISMLRANFDGITSTGVADANIEGDCDGMVEFKTGARVTNVEYACGKVSIHDEHIENGILDLITADIAIVADGSNSSIRNTLHPAINREYAGYMCWRGTIQEYLVDGKWNRLYPE